MAVGLDVDLAAVDDDFHRLTRPEIGLDGLAVSDSSISPASRARAPGLHGELERLGHRHRIVGERDGGVDEHAVGAELHALGRLRRRTETGIDDHRHLGLLDHDLDRVRSFRPRPEPIGDASGITVAQPASSSFLWRPGPAERTATR